LSVLTIGPSLSPPTDRWLFGEFSFEHKSLGKKGHGAFFF
jgi:hypothetical protein